MKHVGQYSGTTDQTWLSLRSLNPSLNLQAVNLERDSWSLPCYLTSVGWHPIALAPVLCPAFRAKGALVFRHINSLLRKHKYALWVFEKEQAPN